MLRCGRRTMGGQNKLRVQQAAYIALAGMHMDPQGARAYILAKLRHELPAGRTYHSLEHTLDVYASAIGIAEHEGIEGDDVILLKIAALFHDSGFTEQDELHEEGSCRIVRGQLPVFGFNAD